MRAAALLLPVLIAACGSSEGQRVPVLLFESSLECVKGEAVLALDQPEDFYLAELIEAKTGDRLSVPARRTGSIVRFACPEGTPLLIVRHASVLAEKIGDAADVPETPAAEEEPPGSEVPGFGSRTTP